MTTFPTETVRANPDRSNAPDARTEPLIRLHGFDAAVVRAGTALAQWGSRRAARRALRNTDQVYRSRLLEEHDEMRTTAIARSHSGLLP